MLLQCASLRSVLSTAARPSVVRRLTSGAVGARASLGYSAHMLCSAQVWTERFVTVSTLSAGAIGGYETQRVRGLQVPQIHTDAAVLPLHCRTDGTPGSLKTPPVWHYRLVHVGVPEWVGEGRLSQDEVSLREWLAVLQQCLLGRLPISLPPPKSLNSLGRHTCALHWAVYPITVHDVCCGRTGRHSPMRVLVYV